MKLHIRRFPPALAAFFAVALLADISRGDSWVLVSTSELAPAAAPLLQLRRRQGFAVTEALFDHNATFEEVRKRITELSRPDEKTYVLLLGCWDPKAPGRLPSGRGRHGRMLAQMTDSGYSASAEGHQIRVGRLPARNPQEAKAMVAKVVRAETRRTAPLDANRLCLFLGNPGGAAGFQRQVGESIVSHLGNEKLKQLHPMWRPVCLVDMPNSAFSVQGEFGKSMLTELRRPHLFSLYFGHSSARGVGASDGWIPASRYGELEQPSPSVMFTCGCYSCQLHSRTTSYSLQAIRNPNGPAAVIGAHGESYAVAGRLAADGLTDLFRKPGDAVLGDYFTAVRSGLADGQVNQLLFFLFDQADGSRGKTTLTVQRKEHLEMWTLIGDPAMKLATIQPTLPVQAEWNDHGGLNVESRHPSIAASRSVTIELESRDPAPDSKELRFGESLATVSVKSEDGRTNAVLNARRTTERMALRIWITSDDAPTLLGATEIVRSSGAK